MSFFMDNFDMLSKNNLKKLRVSKKFKQRVLNQWKRWLANNYLVNVCLQYPVHDLCFMKKIGDDSTHRVISHENLIEATCSYIDMVIEQNKSAILDENSKGVKELLICFENIFYDSLKDPFKWQKNWKIWRWIASSCEHVPQSCVPLVNSLDNLQSGLSKLRAFLRLALQSKRIRLYLDTSFSFTEAIRRLYHPTTVLLSPQLRRVVSAAVDLQYLDFCFDLKNDDLNFPYVGQIDFAYLLNYQRSFKYTNPATIVNGYIVQKGICKRCLEYALKADTSESQKRYLEDVIRDTNRRLHSYKDEVSRLSNDNARLRAAFEQLQTKVVLLHEEFIRSSHHRPNLSCQGLSLHQRSRLPVDWSASEATDAPEDLWSSDFLPTSLAPNIISSSKRFDEFKSSVRRHAVGDDTVDSTAIEATEDLDYIDLVFDQCGSDTIVPSSLSDSCCYIDCSQSQNCKFVVGEQKASECPEVYRLPGTAGDEELSAALDNLMDPFDLSQLSVTVKPFDTNYRARFSVPKTSGRESTLRRAPPQLDLFSELQLATDSSFPLTGLSAGEGGDCPDETEGACSTSDQVSEMVNELAIGESETTFDGDIAELNDFSCYDDSGTVYCTTATSSSRNTVLTSTSTIRPAISCSSLASPSSTYGPKAAMDPPMVAFRRSSSDLLVRMSTRETTLCGSTGECWKPFAIPPRRLATATPPPQYMSCKQ